MKRVLALSTLVVALAVVHPAHAQLQIASSDGSMTLKFGLLAQLQAETLDNTGDNGTANDLYIRRLRVLMGGKLWDKVSFFLETDSPNLGKGVSDGTKTSGDVFIQDFIVTFAASKTFNLDTGLILIPNSYNSEQSAAALLPVDYGPYSFLASGPTGSRVGRDYGIQARGYLASNHFEYRAGIFQGARGEAGDMPFRYVARVVWYPFEAQTGYFYTGTTHGKKKLLGLGASYDHQEHYDAYGADLFLDLPVHGGDGITFQADWLRYDGGTTFTTLPEEDTYLLEAAYYFSKIKLSPFVEYAIRDLTAVEGADETKLQAGLAWWPRGHNLNLKLGAGTLTKDGTEDRTLVQLQLQLFFF